MNGKIISHEDFMTVEKLSDEHLKLVRKRDKGTQKNTVITVCLVLFIGCPVLILTSRSQEEPAVAAALVIFIVLSAAAALIAAFTAKTVAAAYGTVTELICAKRILQNHYDPEILPWENDKYKKNEKTGLTTTEKYFYYINAETSAGCLQHICCYKSDYKRLSVGDRVLIVKYGNGNIVCYPVQ